MEQNQRIFSIGDFYFILKDALKSIKHMRKAKKLLDENFTHRIMLCVTEVNGCKGCSYFHTELALKDGMSDEEITSILSGNLENIPPGEGTGLFFAQHYADKKGDFDIETWQRLVEEYGEEKAKAILASTRTIMMGNAYGIAIGSFLDRFRGKRIKGSNLFTELGIILGIIIMIPVVLIHLLIEIIIKIFSPKK